MEEDESRKFISIIGVNENNLKNNKLYYLQTEIIINKKIILNQIFDKGRIILSDFISFNKYYKQLIDLNSGKLKKGVEGLVNLLHRDSIFCLRWLEEKDFIFLISPIKLLYAFFKFEKNFSLGLGKFELKRYLYILTEVLRNDNNGFY